jgi:AraC family transcriptional regulator of adaptative response/methylated-DNA-[protein]-cysteine methyltransferase
MTATTLHSSAETILSSAWLDTPLGSMLAVADATYLYLINFIERSELESATKWLCKRTNAVIVAGRTAAIDSIEYELKTYFDGNLKKFKTPLRVIGTDFQQQVWKALLQIPYGETRSYAEQASSIGKPTAFRAVANANGANQFGIVIPCHRVINTSGSLGGYGGGISRKAWLLQHECAPYRS